MSGKSENALHWAKNMTKYHSACKRINILNKSSKFPPPPTNNFRWRWFINGILHFVIKKINNYSNDVTVCNILIISTYWRHVEIILKTINIQQWISKPCNTFINFRINQWILKYKKCIKTFLQFELFFCYDEVTISEFFFILRFRLSKTILVTHQERVIMLWWWDK